MIAADGSATYVVPPATANPLTSPASWVTFELPPDAKSTGNIPFIEMPAGARVPVKFQVTVPEGAAPGDRQAVLFFEMYSPPGVTETPTARVNARIGARIETRVKGEVVEKVDVRPFAMPSFVVGSSPGYAFTVRNDGNVDTRVDARLVVLDRSENERSSTVVLTDAPVYASSALEKKGVLQLPGAAIGPDHRQARCELHGRLRCQEDRREEPHGLGGTHVAAHRVRRGAPGAPARGRLGGVRPGCETPDTPGCRGRRHGTAVCVGR